MARVSVIIPTYNRFRLLCRAVESALQQTYDDLEIIVVDDGSVDETSTEFSKRFPSVQYLRIPHSGLPAIARNVGISLAQGDYVAFLDSDDQWLPEKLALQVEALDRNPAAGLACSNAFVIHNDHQAPTCPYLRADQGKNGRVLEALVEENFVITSTALARRSVLNRVGVFGEEAALQFGEDYDLWLRIAAVSELVYLFQALAIYRDVPSASIRGQISEARHWEARLLILKRLRGVLRRRMADCGEIETVVTNQETMFHEYCLKALWAERAHVRAVPHLLALCRRQPRRVARAALRRIGNVVRYRIAGSVAGRNSHAQPVSSNGCLKLHLGCGDMYLPGYVNVDFPPSRHSVQVQSKADVFADLTHLEYQDETVDEIRLHHVFEHFERPVALSLLVQWYAWLKDGGRLVIETPDFERCILEYLKGGMLPDRMKIVRHLFGSHEATWAVHYDGWYRDKFERILTCLGYRDLEFSFQEWQGTYNIIVTATKRAPFTPKPAQIREVEAFLALSLLDDSPTEKRMLEVWMARFEHHRVVLDSSCPSSSHS